MESNRGNVDGFYFNFGAVVTLFYTIVHLWFIFPSRVPLSETLFFTLCYTQLQAFAYYLTI